MPRDLLAALAMVAVLEGLLLFAAPEAWRRMAEHLLTEPSARLRRHGGFVLLAGLAALWWIRG